MELLPASAAAVSALRRRMAGEPRGQELLTVPALKKLEGPLGVSGLPVRLGLGTHPPVEPWSSLSLYFLQCPVQMESLALPVLSLQM